MVPQFEKFLYPFLLSLKDGELTIKEMRERITAYFDLSEEDLQVRTKSGKVTQVNDRIGWARQYFRRALLIDIPKNGTYCLTQRGKDFLKKHPKSITIDDLMEIPEYATYNVSHKPFSGNASVMEDEVLTPDAQLEQVYRIYQKNTAAEILDKVMALSPNMFERLVVDLLVSMGYGDKDSAQVTQYSHDEGIDGIIYEDKLGLDKIYIQAKRWTNSVGSPEVQQFSGALVGKKATKGVFITTSTFTSGAAKFVETVSNQKIILIDGERLSLLMFQYNIGVQTENVYITKRIDNDYFEE
ncbi:MAG: restriction endonuclease [Bacteroidales bacterium]|nr:restriction endonuclease [Bacteroidales bacterium]